MAGHVRKVRVGQSRRWAGQHQLQRKKEENSLGKVRVNAATQSEVLRLQSLRP